MKIEEEINNLKITENNQKFQSEEKDDIQILKETVKDLQLKTQTDHNAISSLIQLLKQYKVQIEIINKKLCRNDGTYNYVVQNDKEDISKLVNEAFKVYYKVCVTIPENITAIIKEEPITIIKNSLHFSGKGTLLGCRKQKWESIQLGKDGYTYQYNPDGGWYYLSCFRIGSGSELRFDIPKIIHDCESTITSPYESGFISTITYSFGDAPAVISGGTHNDEIHLTTSFVQNSGSTSFPIFLNLFCKNFYINSNQRPYQSSSCSIKNEESKLIKSEVVTSYKDIVVVSKGSWSHGGSTLFSSTSGILIKDDNIKLGLEGNECVKTNSY
jgi:hypothetical protein